MLAASLQNNSAKGSMIALSMFLVNEENLKL